MILHVIKSIVWSAALLALPCQAGALESGQASFAANRTRAVLVMKKEQMGRHRDVSAVLLLHSLLRSFATPGGTHVIAEQYALRYLQLGNTWSATLHTETTSDATKILQRLSGPSLSTPGRVRLYRLLGSRQQLVTQLSPTTVLEGAEPAMHALLAEMEGGGVPEALSGLLGPTGALYGIHEPERAAELASRFASLADPGSPATLYYFAQEASADLVEIISDLDWIWRAGLGAAVEPFAQPLRLLGNLDGVRADMWEKGSDVVARIVLAAPSPGAAKRSSLALGFGRQLGKLASSAAVRAGAMAEADAVVLGAILDSIEFAVDEDLVIVHLRVQKTALFAPQ